jgi:DNA repair exonuclease SbcCD nuclease subunit
MIDLRGKTLVFGDLHLGIKSDSLARLFVDVKFVEFLLDYVKKHSIDNLIFLGDWFNSREFINTITLSVGFELVSLLAKNVKEFVFILGNHDLESNSYQNVSSVIGYDTIKNVHLIKEPTDGIVNGKYTLFVPWGFSNAGFDVIHKFDYIFGHFSLPGNYIRYNKININNLDAIKEENLQTNDVRAFCDECLEVGGVCFSGHIHVRSEQTYHENRIIFVGSPFEMSYGETNSSHGFYIIDKQNNIRFDVVMSESIPRHITLKISSCFDEDGKLRTKEAFSYLKGNIVKKIIDKDLSSSEAMQLNDMLNSLDIFEFAQAEYGSLSSTLLDENQTPQTETTALTIDSYFDTVIQALDEETLKNSNVTKEELKECFLSYVKKLIDMNG